MKLNFNPSSFFISYLLIIPITLGILIGYYFPISLNFACILLFINILPIFICYFFFKNNYLISFFFFLGISCLSLFLATNSLKVKEDEYYLNYLREGEVKVIFEPTKCSYKNNNSNCEGNILAVFKNDSLIISKGKSIIFLNGSDELKNIELKSKVYLKGNLKEINFNDQNGYFQYLLKKGISSIIKINYEDLISLEHNKSIVNDLKNKSILFFERVTYKYIGNNSEGNLFKALIIGVTGDISKEYYSNYSNSGISHILSVSGMHVGIIFLIVNSILNQLFSNKKNELIIKTILCIIIIWLYAILTGLLSSIIRASFIFSLISIGLNISKPSNNFNTLAIAFIFILIIYPLELFNIGFQFSFLSCFGIFYLYPKLTKYLNSNIYLLNKIIQLICISLSAQLFTGPLSVYYFKTFPLYFLIPNLFVGSIVFISFCNGIILLIFSFFEPLGNFLGMALFYQAKIINFIADIFGNLPYSVIKFDKINLYLILIIYLIIFLIIEFPFFKIINILSKKNEI